MRIKICLILCLLLSSLGHGQPQPWRLAEGAAGIFVYDLDIYSSDPDTLYAIGDVYNVAPKFLRSTDRGEHWDTIPRFEIQNVLEGAIRVDPVNSRRIYIVYLPMVIFSPGLNVTKVSTDGGQTWDSLFARRDEPAIVVEIDPSNRNTVYVGYGSGWLKRTTDGGSTWQDVSLMEGAVGLSSLVISYSDSQLLYASTLDHIFKTTNGGNTWDSLNIGFSFYTTTRLAIDPTNHDIVYAAVQDYGVFKTTNGGETWNEMSVGLGDSNRYLNCIAVNPRNPRELFIGVSYPVWFFRTTNGGESWLRFDNGLPTFGHARSIAIDTLNNRIYLAGTSGIYILDSALTSVSVDDEDLQPEAIRLYQNFPNPFNSSTTIQFEVGKRSYVRLAIYDALGRETSVFVDGWVEPGVREVAFSANLFASGAYFMRLTTNGRVLVRKLVLLK